MRDFIEIIREAAKGFKSGPFEQFYQQVVREGGMMFGADEDELGREEVKRWIATHRKLFRNGVITVWRTLQLTEQEMMAIKPGTELGNHWTFEFDDSVIENFHISREALRTNSKQIYVFEAKIETGDVAFPLTVAYNVYFPHENEIFLDSRMATPRIVSVRRLDTSYDWYLEEENLRPDLVGAVMRA